MLSLRARPGPGVLPREGGEGMPKNDIYTRARSILSKLQIPRNECERYKRDWARAVVNRNDSVALREWRDYCRYLQRCRIGE